MRTAFYRWLATGWPVGALVVSLGCAGLTQAAGFILQDTPGEYLDVLHAGKSVGRYMYAYDKSTPARLHETYKPYLHVFDAEGQAPITKGSGGLYTHHRGVFVGWNRIGFGGKTYDRWHMKGGEQVHREFLVRKAGPEAATFTSLVHWNDESEKPLLVERRTMTFRTAPAPVYVLLDLSTTLEAPNGDVRLDGDPEHAGIQFRPANEVVVRDTVYVFPKEGADPKKDRDYPWVGETFTLNSRKYSVVQMNHPANPKGTVYSAYRNYGRFGAFFKHDLKSGESLTVNYRWLVYAGPLPEAEVIQRCWEEFGEVKAAAGP